MLEANLLVDGCLFTNCVQRAIRGNVSNTGAAVQAVIHSVFIGNAETGSGGGGALNIQDYGGGVTVTDCWFEGNNSVNGGGAVLLAGFQPWIVQDCTFWNNHDSIAGGALYTAASVGLTNNVFSGSIGFQAVRNSGSFISPKKCNIYWNNAGGNTVGFTMGTTDRIVDPQYCDAPTGDLTVYDTSPCLPANSLGCGLIGAHDMGCGLVSFEPRSWGRIKEGYR